MQLRVNVALTLSNVTQCCLSQKERDRDTVNLTVYVYLRHQTNGTLYQFHTHLCGFLRSILPYMIFISNGFLPRDTMRKRGLCCRPMSVCLSVRPSDTLVHRIQTAEDIVKLLSRCGSPIILVFLTPSADTQFQGQPLQRGRKIHGGGNILRFSTEIAVYLGNGTR